VLVTTMREAFGEARLDEGVYCLYLTGDQARATLRALGRDVVDDADAAAAHGRLQRLLEPRQSERQAEAEEDDARQRLEPPYDLPDADALLAFAAPAKRGRRAHQA
jgi:hypothetical protein